MPRKKKEEIAEPVVDEIVEELEPKIARLEDNFGREDLNKLRDKLNELIDAK
jgi:hypothetical protein